MSLWAFRFILWYICILLVQPQNRFTFLWPYRIAYMAFLFSAALHFLSSLEGRRPLIRLGPATILALALLFFATISQHFGVYQRSPSWNYYYDMIVKNSVLLIMVEAMATSVERVWAVQMTSLIATLWWVKAGVQLIRSGSTYSGDRLMGAAVSLIENPNGFAYMMCVFLPLYLYAYQQAKKKWQRVAFLLCAFAAVLIILETGSRTGLVTLIAMGVFLVPHYMKNRWKSLVLVVIAIGILYPMTSEGNKRRFRTIPQSILSFLKPASGPDGSSGGLTQDEQSAQERGAKNRDTWALIKAYPVFGVGVNPDNTKYLDRFPMTTGQVHCEILMAGRQMGFIGMGIYAGLVGVIFFGGRWVRLNAKHWPALRDLGWTFQMQGLATAVGGSFCPLPWLPPMMMLAGSASALVSILKAEQEAERMGRIGAV